MPGRHLRVGFDGRDLLRKRTGVVNYAVHLARRLASRPGTDFLVYADAYHDSRVQPPADVPLRRLSAPPVLWKHAALPLALARDRVSVFHSPTGTLPLWAPARQVVTIHDLFADVEPGWFPPRVALQLQRAQRRAARVADAIVAVSDRTRQDVVERYGVPPAQVRVVHNGVDLARFTPESMPGEIERVRGRFRLDGPFILCVGSLMPWRNAPRLLEAVAALRERQGVDPALLFVGRDIWGTDPTQRLAGERGWDTWARFAGYVADEDLPALYRAADLLVYPSLYEGFGIPPVEAMACGTPVVASDRGAIPEVVGDAALLPDPTDVDALVEAMRRALEDGDLRRELRARGLARAARYSWDRAAEQTLDVYEAVVG